VITQYLNTRLKPITFLALAIVLALLNNSPFSTADRMNSILFLFYSFLVFRLLDDAGSVIIDRVKHPARDYLVSKVNYPKFLRLTIINILIYLGVLAFLATLKDASIISLFLAASLVCYFLLKKSEIAVALIALLKYPLLIWCTLNWQSDGLSISLALASFFLMGAHELLGKQDFKSYFLGLLSLIVSGLLIFQTWYNPYTLVHLVPVLLLVIIFRKSAVAPIAPLVIKLLTYFLAT